mmetsp:Transcript_10333/g.14846  ORF Transcript_10333/g.14846 Transcript_10333/m.14846 type:complete len:82 (+) Transcript_10333:200-445(+)
MAKKKNKTNTSGEWVDKRVCLCTWGWIYNIRLAVGSMLGGTVYYGKNRGVDEVLIGYNSFSINSGTQHSSPTLGSRSSMVE